jgi:hypothetical protein
VCSGPSKQHHDSNLQGILFPYAISGKIDYFDTPILDSKSTAWQFFTDD